MTTRYIWNFLNAVHLLSRGQEPTANEVAKFMGRHVVATGHILSDMARDGLLRKRMLTKGAAQYSLTPEGRAALEEGADD